MEGWKKMAFADVATKFFSGGTPSTKDSSLWDGDIQWITSKWLNERLYLSYGEKNISEKGLRSSATKLVKARSLILATRVGVGKVSINEIDLAINQDLLGIEIDEHDHSLEFLAYQLRSQKSQDYISSFKRGATIQGVTQDCIKSIELNIPPLPEQRKIAHVLSTMQKAIEQQDKLIRTTTELKKALMQKLFSEGTRGESQRESEIGLVPVSWEVVELGKTVDFKTGKLNSNAADENGIYPFFTCSQETFAINNYSFDQEAILLSGNNARAIYSVKHYNGKFNAYQRTYVLTILNEVEYDYTFLKYVLIRQLEYLRSISIGSQTRYLTLGMLKTLQIQKPDMEEQKKIAKSIFIFENKIEILEMKKQTLTALFKTLLHELMTGQRRVHELEFEKMEDFNTL